MSLLQFICGAQCMHSIYGHNFIHSKNCWNFLSWNKLFLAFKPIQTKIIPHTHTRKYVLYLASHCKKICIVYFVLLIRIPHLQPNRIENAQSLFVFSIYIECDVRTLDRNDRICLCLRVYYECSRRLLVDLPLNYLLHGIGACRIHFYMAHHFFGFVVSVSVPFWSQNFNVHSMVKYKCQNQAKISIEWMDSEFSFGGENVNTKNAWEILFICIYTHVFLDTFRFTTPYHSIVHI